MEQILFRCPACGQQKLSVEVKDTEDLDHPIEVYARCPCTAGYCSFTVPRENLDGPTKLGYEIMGRIWGLIEYYTFNKFMARIITLQWYRR